MVEENRELRVKFPEGTEKQQGLRLAHATWTEEVSHPFVGRVELIHEDHNLDLQTMVSQPITIEMVIDEGTSRYFSGLVTRFEYTGNVGRFAQYVATVRPWLWYLTRTADCRIFQEETVPDIVLKVFRDNGFSDFESRVESSDYRTWNYCVQYRETDFNFVSRLLEQEGIRYFFKHEDGRHVLVLANTDSTLDEGIEGIADAEFHTPGRDVATASKKIMHWEVAHEAQPGFFSHTDYDFEQSRSDLLTSGFGPEREHAHSAREIFDYPGEYVKYDDGMNYATVRIQELYSQYEVAEGHGSFRGIAAGHSFKLVSHPRTANIGSKLVLSATHELQAGNYESSDQGGEDNYTVHLTAIDDSIPFRPPRITPKPVVQGPQTATVVAPVDDDSKEIWTETYGSVRVRFHWDRRDKDHEHDESDQNRDFDAEKAKEWTCWVRVSQGWAGKNWGQMFLPHVGHEVIVSFLEGDPDRPIITGRVYNDQNKPPLTLPDHQTKAVIRDVWGNQLTFNSNPDNPHIDLYHPPCSFLQMSKEGIQLWSCKKKDEVVHGNVTKCNYGLHFSWFGGTKASCLAGASISVVLGTKMTLSIGAAITIHAGVSYAFTKGGRYEYASGFKYEDVSGPTLKTSDGDAVTRSNAKIVLDSKEDTVIAGGEEDQAKLIAQNDVLLLAYGTSSEDQKADDDKERRKAKSALWGGFIAAVGAATAATAAGMKVHKKKLEEGKCADADQPIVESDALLDGLFGAGILAGALGTGKYMKNAKEIKKDVAEADREYTDKHDQRFAEVRLTAEGLELKALDGDPEPAIPPAVIKLLKDGNIQILCSGDLTAEVDGKIELKAGDDFTIKSTSKVEIDAPEVKLPHLTDQ